ncbi:MAG: hypothetical protein ACODAJ_05185 [Planctomycetota bacterium]
MSKRGKSGRGRRGWPRRSKTTGKDAKTDLIDRLSERLEAGTLSNETISAYLHRLVELIDRLPDLGMVLPDTETVNRALGKLPEREREAVLGRSASKRRAARGRAKLSADLFTPGLLDEFASALRTALGHVQDEQDIGAVVCALHALDQTRQGLLSCEQDPLLSLLASLVVIERLRIAQELADAGFLEEGEEPGLGAEEEGRSYAEVIEACPHVRRDVQRRLYRAFDHLPRLIREGVIRARFTDDELSPLLGRLESTFDAAPHGALTGPRAEDVDSDEVDRALEDFLADPANAPAFERFTTELEAELQSALESGHPRAQEMVDAVAAWRELRHAEDLTWNLLLRASLGRMLQEKASHRGESDAEPS